ncbi:MAG TPA: hypothetical protein VF151_10870 [Gemmatimonadales bacterium]
MTRADAALVAFNRGIIDRLGLARIDIKRVTMAAQIQKNYIPRVLGSMMLRPGNQLLGSPLNNHQAKYMDFVFASDDKALVEQTAANMRVWINDAVVQRTAVSSAIANGGFDTDLSGWTDADEAGAASTWATGGYMQLVGTGTNAAVRYQQVTVAAADQGVEHGLHVVIERGPVTMRVGSTVHGQEYLSDTEMNTGDHSFALTPTGNFYIEFRSTLERLTLVDDVYIEAAGDMLVATPWAATDLSRLRWAQSGDILYTACKGFQQRQIERHATRSWSAVLYQPADGPFRTRNLGPITITPSVLSGNGTLTASSDLFKSTHVGALFAVTSSGQNVTKTIGALDDATNAIQVTGVGTDRAFTIILSGLTATGDTVILERSLDAGVTWVAVSGKSWTADTTESYNDALDNETVKYRLRCSVYAAGTPIAELQISTGTVRGVCRITGFTSATSVTMEVLTAFGDTVATDNWEESEWSDYRGWPTAVAFYEGRLCWAGKDSVDLSESDGFVNFDPSTTGDSASISRSIGSGPVDTINWILPLQRLLLGGQANEFSCRSTSLDEPLTPTNFNIKKCSGQGSANVRAIEIDSHGIFAQRSGLRIYQLSMGGDIYSYDYSATDLSALVPRIGYPGIIHMASQRQPDTRIHCLRSDGSVALLIFDQVENVTCWIEVDSPAAGGVIEDIVVLPGDEGGEEDQVYYLIQRTINGAVVRHFVRWALESQCWGDQTLCRLADSFKTGTNSPASATISGLNDYIGEQVVCWFDGKCEDDGTDAHDPKLYTVNAAGEITLGATCVNWLVGLPYTAQFQSAKVADVQAQMAIVLESHKAIRGLKFMLANTHRYGIKLGPDFTNMDNLPSMEEGDPVSNDAIYTDYDVEPQVFPGTFDVDTRVCFQSKAPRPCTVVGAAPEIEFHA